MFRPFLLLLFCQSIQKSNKKKSCRVKLTCRFTQVDAAASRNKIVVFSHKHYFCKGLLRISHFSGVSWKKPKTGQLAALKQGQFFYVFSMKRSVNKWLSSASRFWFFFRQKRTDKLD